MNGWWRVNTETGETLGMTADGYGSDVVEYMIEMVDIAFGLVQALSSLEACNRQTNDVAKMCCLVEANFNNVAGLAAGGLVGATGGAAGAALFTIVDFVAKEATGAALGQSNAVGIMPQAVLGCNEMQATDW